MKIRTQFIISTVVLSSFLLLVSALEIITNQWIQKIHQQEELATQIERQAYELGYLANDYLLYRESQQASRWESKFASFSNDLSNMEVNTPEQQALLANIKTNQQRLKAVFAEVRASIESAPQTQGAVVDTKFMQVSWSRLEVQNQGMIFDASRLARMLREQEDRLRRVTSLLSFVLIVVLGAFLLGNYGLTFRGTLKAIEELRAGTRIIGSGDLDFAIAVKHEDEIGELSRAFNQMTANLKQVTTSKVDLEKEISERKRAENALRESESKYRNLFENMVEEVHFWQIVRDEAGQIKTWRLVDANPPTLKTWGMSSVDDIKGKTTDEIFGPGATEHYMPVVQNIMTEGLPYAYEDYFPNLDRYFRFTSVPLGDYFITTGADITSIKKAEDVLRQKEADLREAQRIAHLGSWYWDARTDATTGSDELLRIYGFDPATQAMPDFSEQRGRCYPVEDWERVNAAVQRTLETGVGYELDVKAIRGSATIWITTSSEVVRDAEGQIVGLRGTVQDISDRKRAEVELVRLASFPERNPNPIVELEYSGDIVYLNPKARELFPDIASSSLKHPILAGLEHLIPKFIEGELEKHIIQEMKAGDAYYHQTVVNIPESGRIRLYNIDITARKQAKEALLEASLQKQASQYARTLIEVSLDPLVTISPEGKITDVNEATVKATGVSREELVGTNFSSYFTEPENAEQGYRQVFAEGYATDYPLTIRRRDGHMIDVLYNASLYKDAHGSVLGAFAAARDVTAQKQAEAELKRHKDNLEMLVKERTSELEESSRELTRSNENLEQFAYVASHDLQEPLRIMSSYSQLLERRYKGRLDQDADEFIDFIVDAAARMQRLITDLLAYSRAGHGTTDLVEVDCNEVVRRLVVNMAATIESADGCVTFDRLPSLIAHESSLIQLFQNLIGNALKFRGEQPPRIHVSARQAEGEWLFSVRDNGIGIEPQYAQRIFMIFQRLHARNKYPGTGIGLSICKKIVETLGGRIWMESEPGQGSTFYFTVPV